MDARTEEIPKIDAPLNGSPLNGSAKNGSAKHGVANGHLTSATPIGPKPAESSEVPATPAPAPWFAEADDASGDGDGDETDFAPSRRMM